MFSLHIQRENSILGGGKEIKKTSKHVLRQQVKTVNKPPRKTILLSQCKLTDYILSYSSCLNSVSETTSQAVSEMCVQMPSIHKTSLRNLKKAQYLLITRNGALKLTRTGNTEKTLQVLNEQL